MVNMDVEIIDVNGRSMRHSASSYNGNAEHNGEGVLDTDDDTAAQEEDVISEPYLGMEFDSEDAAKTFYDEYARSIGFSTKLGHINYSKTDETVTSREFLCSRKGLRKWHSDSCDAMLKIEIKSKDKWVVTNFVKDHSHTLVPPSKLHYLRPRKHFSGSTNADETVPNGVMFVSMDGNQSRVKHPGFVSYMGRQPGSKKTLRKDAQNLLDYFKKMQGENPGFFYAIQLDDENRMVNVFWADARSRTAYSHFGDAITLDTTCCYRSSHYKVPFAPFTGVNHHGQTVLFGCAILLDDSEASFIWLFKSFLAAMKDHSPVSLTTGKEKAIQTAVAKALPQTRHCISKSQVLREGQERLAHVCQFNPNFQVELYNCINLTETVEEFESSWNAILDKYDLRRIDWLQNLYNNRTEWVPVYFRNTFFAALSPHQAYDGSFFNAYVNEQTTLPLFFRQYERALENWFEKEIEADFDTISTSPVLRTPSPMEKQAANLYTKKIFSKFQEELVETFVYTANRIDGDANVSTFRVAKYEDDNKAYTVALNIPEMTASCSCQMFEYSGVLCRHVLTVFTVTNVLTLPSHYILKRWTRNARSGVGSDERSGDLSGQEGPTLRYNHLCREAMKYAEEGAVAIETFNVAMGALREGAKKICATKKNVAKAAPSNPQTSAIGYDDKRKCTSDTTPLLWPRQDEGTRKFNLNDGPIPVPPVADLNLPRMAPVSLHRDDVLSETMVILPCLKSMTWVMEKKNSAPANRVAIISLKLQDQSKTPLGESEIKFQLSGITLEPMLRSMAAISEQLSSPAKRVAVINLKLHDSDTNSGESDVKFQVSRDTLAAMLRSMAYIRVQLSNPAEPQEDPLSKKRRK